MQREFWPEWEDRQSAESLAEREKAFERDQNSRLAHYLAEHSIARNECPAVVKQREIERQYYHARGRTLEDICAEVRRQYGRNPRKDLAQFWLNEIQRHQLPLVEYVEDLELDRWASADQWAE